MNQKGFVNIVLIGIIVILIGTLGYFVFIKKSEQVEQQPMPTQIQTTTTTKLPTSPTSKSIISNGHIVEFEQAVNKSDFTNAGKYFADKVYMILEGSSCCGDVSASRAKQALEENFSGLLFTFDLNDTVVKEYMTSIASDYPSRRLIRNSPKLYFDEYIIGVESDVSQQNKAIMGYKVYNDKITDLFINVGRDR